MPIEYRKLDPGLWKRYRDQAIALEKSVYESARRDSVDRLDEIVLHARSVSVIALAGDAVAGFSLGAPLELFDDVNGVPTDPRFGRGDTLYAADTAVAPAHRRRGVARRLKQHQIETARAAGYAVIAGRVRVGLADAMWKLNRSLGARQVQYLANDYTDDLRPNDCIYYHIALEGC